MTIPYALGGLYSPPDPRDYQVAAFLPAIAPAFPRVFDFRAVLGDVYDQGQEGTCSAHAIAGGLMRYFEHVTPSVAAAFARELSRRACYEGARQLQPVNGEGAIIRAALEYTRRFGLPLEADQPYQANHPTLPGPLAATHAPENKIAGYAAVGLSVAELKAAMFHLGPLVIALEAFDGLFSPDPTTHIVRPTGASHGGHALCLAGWNDDTASLIVRNSWGAGWGDRGYFALPYDASGQALAYPIKEAWSATQALLPDGTPPPPAEPWWVSLERFLRIVP